MLANQTAEIIDIAGKPAIDAFIDTGHGVMAVKGFQVCAGYLEIENAGVVIHRFIEKASGILNEFNLFAI